ncbi:MAG: serine acetyltransferase [Firmicutes bacterium]|nr:serine acetyltransferase [Bacillota bacterium]
MENFLERRQGVEDLLSCLLREPFSETEAKVLLKFGIAKNIDNSKLEEFLSALGETKQSIKKDQQFLYDNDPSVTGVDQIASFTSFFAVAAYRIAHIFPCEKIARQISEFAKSLTGVDIHPKAKIGVPFAVDHGVGTVIGETAVIGDSSMLYHGVTLGAKHLKEREQVGEDRHPKLGNKVIVYSNTTILGNINVPDGLIIGANKFIKSQQEIDELQSKFGSR